MIVAMIFAMTTTHRNILGLLCLAVLLVVFPSPDAQAQPQPEHGVPGQPVPEPWERPDLWIHIQDSVWIFRYSDGNRLAPIGDERASASYFFTMSYDSTSRVSYLFTEPKVNGNRIRLLHWKDKRVVNAEAAYLSFNSRTDNFPVTVGDTVSFYREMWWINPLTRQQGPNNYRALDTLRYSVWLVRASDTQTVALLDSMTIMPSPQPGPPTIYATQPIIAVVRFVVPTSIIGDSMFMGVRVEAQGPGQFHFTRRDDFTVGRSKILNRSQEYLMRYSHVLGKRPAEDLTGHEDPASTLRVETVNQSEIRISFSGGAGGTRLVIYDQDGNVIAYPYATSAAAGTRAASYRFLSSGAYFVALEEEGRIVATCKVAITQ